MPNPELLIEEFEDGSAVESAPAAPFDKEGWMSRGRELGAAYQAANWALGDWLVEGIYALDGNTDAKDFTVAERIMGLGRSEAYELAEQVTGLSRSTLKDIASTARRM